MYCKKCGKEISDDANVCGYCGAETGKIRPSYTGAATHTGSKKNIITICVIVGVVILCVISGVLLPKVIKSTTDYMEMGDYLSAYNKATTEDQKSDIMMENAYAVSLKDLIASDNDDYDINEVYYCEETDEETLENDYYIIMVANDYYEEDGVTEDEYIQYMYNADKKTWELDGTAVPLDFLDDISDQLQDSEYDVYFELRLSSVLVESNMENGTKLSLESVNRVNELYKNGTLQDCTWIGIEME